MKYDDLWNVFVQSKAQRGTKGMIPIKNRPDAPAVFMKPEDMQSALNAFTPFDAILHPNHAPDFFDYGTEAYNIRNEAQGANLGLPRGIIFASEESRRLPINATDPRLDFLDRALPDRRFANRAIYAHELGHEDDPRLNPYGENHGFITGAGLPGAIYSREGPAMDAEDNFWRTLKRTRQARKN